MAEGLRTRLVDLDDDSDVVGSSLDRTQIAAMWCADILQVPCVQCCLRSPTSVTNTSTLLVCFRFNQLAFAVFLTLPYTLAVYLVRDFEGDKGTEGSVGRDTGLLVSQLCG